MHRVLKPGGNALVIDLRKHFSPRAVKDYARRHGLFAGSFIRLTFNTVLKKRAYTKDSITELVAQSQFGQAKFASIRSASNCGCINEY
jgi:ubiquinone/menaquinone biosynthesis C-methylase UbiE